MSDKPVRVLRFSSYLTPEQAFYPKLEAYVIVESEKNG